MIKVLFFPLGGGIRYSSSPTSEGEEDQWQAISSRSSRRGIMSGTHKDGREYRVKKADNSILGQYELKIYYREGFIISKTLVCAIRISDHAI